MSCPLPHIWKNTTVSPATYFSDTYSFFIKARMNQKLRDYPSRISPNLLHGAIPRIYRIILKQENKKKQKARGILTHEKSKSHNYLSSVQERATTCCPSLCQRGSDSTVLCKWVSLTRQMLKRLQPKDKRLVFKYNCGGRTPEEGSGRIWMEYWNGEVG